MGCLPIIWNITDLLPLYRCCFSEVTNSQDGYASQQSVRLIDQKKERWQTNKQTALSYLLDWTIRNHNLGFKSYDHASCLYSIFMVCLVLYHVSTELKVMIADSLNSFLKIVCLWLAWMTSSLLDVSSRFSYLGFRSFPVRRRNRFVTLE